MQKILVNAYACCPGMGSEQGMGWNFVTGLAKTGCEVFVVTESEYATGISEKIKVKSEELCDDSEWCERLHFYFVPIGETEVECEKIRRMCWNQGNWAFYHYYAKWQKKALVVAQDIINNLEQKGDKIDVMHQLNMAGFREPGMLYRINEEREKVGKERIPLVWGPMTGYGNVPFRFMTPGGLKFTAFFLLKNALNTLQLVFHHRVRKMMKASDWVLATSPEMMHGIKKFYGRQVERLNETGTTLASPASEKLKVKSEKSFDNRPFRLIWVGRFVYTKQLSLALRTIKRLKEDGSVDNIELHIVGKGFTDAVTEDMHRTAKELDVDDICRWHGFIPNEEVHKLMRECDLFFFTSIFEGTSTVMLEAIQNNLPVVCFDRCGFGPVVDESIGRKIVCKSPDQAVNDFASQIKYLYENPNVLRSMAENCEAKKVEMSWDRKIQRLMDIYRSIAANE